MRPAADSGYIDPDFLSLVEALAPKHAELVAMRPVKAGTLPRNMPERGVYLFSEEDQHLYVGRTNTLRQRVASHRSADHKKAAFAFRLARLATGQIKASYASKGSRDALMEDAAFADAFGRARARIAAMDLRYVDEPNPVRQALLEIYVATVLGTPHNDFDNH